MATVDNLFDRIQARGYGFDTEATQLIFLDAAWSRLLNLRRWKFADTSETVPLAAGDNNLSLTTDIVGSVRFLDGIRLATGYTDLDYVDSQQFRTMIQGREAERGTPRLWTRRNDELIFWPVPTQTTNLKVDYNKRLPTLASLNPTVDQIPAPAPFEDIVVLGALQSLADRDRDPASREAFATEYGQLLGEFLAAHGIEQRETSGRVQKSGFYDSMEPGLIEAHI